MKRSLGCSVFAAVAVCGVFVAGARAETWKLALKHIPEPGKATSDDAQASPAYVQWAISPQHFFRQIFEKEGPKDEQEAEFAKLVKKQPEKYNSPQPFRGIATLGSDKYAFVLDAKDAKSDGYARLYFDTNHNGDLTDDKAFEGEGERMARGARFPRVDLTVTAGEAKVDYSFFFQVYWQNAGNFKYASASLTAAIYREGEINVEGKKSRVILIDANSNGRFDDEIKVLANVQAADGQVYFQSGDLLLIDPDPKVAGFRRFGDGANSTGHPVSKLVRIDDRYYDARFSAAGDSLALAPSPAKLGRVESPHEGFRALVQGEQGVVKIACDKSHPALLPAGEWRLLNYTIDRPDWKEPPPSPAEKEKAKTEKPPKVQKSLMQLLGEVVMGQSGGEEESLATRSGPTSVSAAATGKCPAIKIVAGQTSALPFGPPYKPMVKAFPQSNNLARLQLSLIGAAGEVCDDLMVRGGRPSKPQFIIKTPKGEVVDRGNFEYG